MTDNTENNKPDENIQVKPISRGIPRGLHTPTADRKWNISPDARSDRGRGRSGLKKGQAPTRTPEEIKEYCRTFGYEAVDTLVSAMRDGENHLTRMRAACEILNRGVGRPSQQIEHVGPHGGPIQEIRAIVVDPQIIKGEQ